MLSAAQCRMARAALQWAVKDLAREAKMSRTTIIRFENGHAAPIPATLTVLRQVFEKHGLEFIDDEHRRGVIVRERK
jgi:transcriptional regulator with XRE-family HTH domain